MRSLEAKLKTSMKSAKLILLFLFILLVSIIAYYLFFVKIGQTSETILHKCSLSKEPTKYDSFIRKIITDSSLNVSEKEKKISAFLPDKKYFISTIDNPNVFDECENKINIKKGEIIEVESIFPFQFKNSQGEWGVSKLQKIISFEHNYVTYESHYFYIFLEDFEKINPENNSLSLQSKNDLENERILANSKDNLEYNLKKSKFLSFIGSNETFWKILIGIALILLSISVPKIRHFQSSKKIFNNRSVLVIQFIVGLCLIFLILSIWFDSFEAFFNTIKFLIGLFLVITFIVIVYFTGIPILIYWLIEKWKELKKEK